MDNNTNADRLSRWLAWAKPAAGPSAAQEKLIGKRATTEAELRTEARDYVRSRMYSKGGLFREAIAGLRHKTLPFWFGRESSITLGKIVSLTLRALIIIGAAFLPVLGRRTMFSNNMPNDGGDLGFDRVAGLLGDLTGTDYFLGACGAIFIGLPKLIDVWQKTSRPRAFSQYGELAAAIDKMPPLEAGDHNALQFALTHALSALRSEMTELIGDESRKRVTDVTLLQYCDAAGSKMQVTARTAVGEPTHRPRDAFLFLANFVGREGRWFAEHDFLRRRNPFKHSRLTVQGNPRVSYRSVLYLPILTAIRKHNLLQEQHGPMADITDCCMGVICVHSERPYRFWRWGDHNKDNGGGFGNVAIERALPYISLVTKLVERSAHKVPLEAA